jgi:hypothetical protein
MFRLFFENEACLLGSGLCRYGRPREGKTRKSPFFEIASVVVCFDHIARFIVNANHSIVRAAEKLGVTDCIADCVWLGIPQVPER